MKPNFTYAGMPPVTDTALLIGGPRDTEVVDIDSPACELHFPRYRDDGSLVTDVYANVAARLHGEKLAYRYEGEQIPPPGNPVPAARSRRERIGRSIERLIDDLHDGLIAGFEKLWYG